MSQLNSLNKQQAITLATRMKRKAQNVSTRIAEGGRRAGGAVAGAVAAAGLGWWMGGLTYDYEQLVAKYGGNDKIPESEGGDPRDAFAGVPKDAVAAIFMAALAIGVPLAGGKGGRAAQPYLDGAAIGASGEVLGRMSYEYAKEQAAKDTK